ncbi:hypothetical protein I3760_08G045400 [Carya illinoinensis]|nr:hypothetical protein I3760_08G045400 [Carya illinoinensis]KAG2692276.1 hypothetical protein I3760_08G045400 [Carya illinoinensis]KAG2692277.1 hypothetical protein I3760_08G045400 [Carya illinoinensis]KAG2692278.1 hypothetical protein I3760_08G045400 [Carya illinoinensis]KAG2692279.1 hypothetical protein I3760_08G045400 [Carya illinoinensis]
MDSGDSGSMQYSSSGGDEEYDSRAESTPTFINPPGHYSSISNPQPLIFSQNQTHQFDLLDLSSNYHHAFSQSQVNSNPNSMLNLDAVPSRGLRSEANGTDIRNLPAAASSLSGQFHSQGSRPSSLQIRPVHDDGTARATAQPNVARNSKKRTRATRRAPTTVLTTDTSNFRAMVQEFTGIPSPPFSASPYSRRLDLFGSSSALRSSGNLEPVGVRYPLHPSPQKAHPSPSLLNNTLGDACTIASSTANNNFITVNNFHQIQSSLDPSRQPRNMRNVQPPILAFQSLPETSLHPSLNVSGFGAPSPGSVAIPFLEELGMSHGHLNVNLSGLPNHELAGSKNATDQDHLRSLDDSYGKSASVGGCKLSYSASPSSGFINHEKGFLNMSARDEGTVDSWICPSD